MALSAAGSSGHPRTLIQSAADAFLTQIQTLIDYQEVMP